ncbi:MAG: hypothetical protein HY738_10840 [Bacteroidia bacterium]|nr:hypothetical protein [Bacteroidia bacterium]
MKTEIITTNDGSHTLFVPSLNEHYHSSNGAINESLHVFIRMGFHYCKSSQISVFEVGFGTGLNALLTLLDSIANRRHVLYHAIDNSPFQGPPGKREMLRAVKI